MRDLNRGATFITHQQKRLKLSHWDEGKTASQQHDCLVVGLEVVSCVQERRPNFLTLRDDLVGREKEAIFSSITKLNTIAVFHTSNIITPIGRGSTGRVDDGVNLSVFVDHAIHALDGSDSTVAEIGLSSSIRGRRGRPAIRCHVELTIGVIINEFKNFLLLVSDSDIVGHGDNFSLREGLRSAIVISAGLFRSTNLAPVIIPVSVRISSNAGGSNVFRSGLSPHAVSSPGIDISIRVDNRNNVNLEVVEHISSGRVRSVQGDHLGDHVAHRGLSDPFARVNTSFPEDDREFALVGGVGDLDNSDDSALVRGVQSNNLNQGRVLLLDRVNPVVEFIPSSVIIEERISSGVCFESICILHSLDVSDVLGISFLAGDQGLHVFDHDRVFDSVLRQHVQEGALEVRSDLNVSVFPENKRFSFDGFDVVQESHVKGVLNIRMETEDGMSFV